MGKARMRIVWLFTIIVSLLLGMGYYFWELNQPIWICKEQVKDKLKAPSTAIFSKMESKDMFLDIRPSGEYESDYAPVVHGMLESQNSFGAMGKMYFYCFEYNKNEKKFGDIVFDEDDTGKYWIVNNKYNG